MENQKNAVFSQFFSDKFSPNHSAVHIVVVGGENLWIFRLTF